MTKMIKFKKDKSEKNQIEDTEEKIQKKHGFVEPVLSFFKEHWKYLLIAILILAIIVYVIFRIVVTVMEQKSEPQTLEESIVLNETVSQDGEETTDTEEIDSDAPIEVPEEPLEEDAYPAVNELVANYYASLQAGDVDAIVAMKSYVSETEKIRIETKCKYIESYQNIVSYTKPGPEENSYIVYVYYEAKLIGIDTLAPGLNPMYLRTDEDGTLYIYDGDLTDQELDYMEAIAAQEDVVDLLTKVSVLYSDAVAADENLKILMTSLQTELDTTVGETIAALEADDTTDDSTGTDTADTDSADTTETDTTDATDTDTTTETETTDTTETVVTTDTVNVRSSDSLTADKLGKVAAGTELVRLEEKANGWSLVMYEGQEGYVSSEYLSVVSTTETGDTEAVIGTVTAKTTVNIRAAASDTSEKLGVAYAGEELDLIEIQSDGWCRLSYNGQTAYVKAEFVEE